MANADWRAEPLTELTIATCGLGAISAAAYLRSDAWTGSPRFLLCDDRAMRGSCSAWLTTGHATIFPGVLRPTLFAHQPDQRCADAIQNGECRPTMRKRCGSAPGVTKGLPHERSIPTPSGRFGCARSSFGFSSSGANATCLSTLRSGKLIAVTRRTLKFTFATPVISRWTRLQMKSPLLTNCEVIAIAGSARTAGKTRRAARTDRDPDAVPRRQENGSGALQPGLGAGHSRGELRRARDRWTSQRARCSGTAFARRARGQRLGGRRSRCVPRREAAREEVRDPRSENACGEQHTDDHEGNGRHPLRQLRVEQLARAIADENRERCHRPQGQARCQ
jgi:hypothetical protein